jgi:hypothetical protein
MRINSDTFRWSRQGERTIKTKVPAAPGDKYVGLVMLFSTITGEPLAIFPDGVVQRMRVASSSALAARNLARFLASLEMTVWLLPSLPAKRGFVQI